MPYSGGGQDIAMYAQTPVIDVGGLMQQAGNIRQQAATLEGTRSENSLRRSQATEVDQQTQDSLIRHAAATAGGDPDQWDKNMQDAYDKGAVGARQFIGRYTTKAVDDVLSSYGGAPAGAQAGGGGFGEASGAQGGAANSTETYDRAFAGRTPAEIQETYRKTSLALQALSRIRDPQSAVAACQKLVAQGIPEAAQFAQMFSQMQPGLYFQNTVRQLYNNIANAHQYVQGRAASSSMGMPAPMISKEIKEAGGGMYAVDPYQGTASELVAPADRGQFIGTTPEGKPIILDTRTSMPMVDGKPYSGEVNAKPGVAMQNWTTKRDAWLEIHHGDYDGAMAIANGKRDMSPAQARASAIALANKSLSDAALTGQQISDPDAYIRQKTNDYYRQITTAAAPSAGGHAPPPTHAGPPPAAVTYLRAHPNLKSAFDEKYGKGAAARVLGQ